MALPKKFLFFLQLSVVLCCEVSDDDAEGGGDATSDTQGDEFSATPDLRDGPSQETSFTDYRFVKIEDSSTSATGSTPGVDIDAVVLQKTESSVLIAGGTTQCFFPVGHTPSHFDCTQAEGEPDPNCADGQFVSLAGAGGVMIAQFESAMTAGDRVVVSDCNTGAGDDASSMQVSVGKSNQNGGTWIPIEAVSGTPGAFTVPALE